MSSNTFGRYLRLTTFGESHGPAVGAVLDGLPPRLKLDLTGVQRELDRRRPGASSVASARREPDRVQVLSGLFDGQTTGAPICMVIASEDARPADYEPLRELLRPGHADATYRQKYGIRDWRGGGRASGRETAARVAAGAVARQLLAPLGVRVVGQVIELAGIVAVAPDPTAAPKSPVRCGDPEAAARMEAAIEQARAEGDSVGGVVQVIASGVPAGWGDPVFGKLDALLAGALMSIGAVKGVEVGDGFALARMMGSESNDALVPGGFATNRAGGVLGGISTGQDLVLRCAVKPTPSIRKTQTTVDTSGQPATISVQGRHDPCIAPRLVPVAEAMTCLVLADAWLAQRALVG
jgi:chorismate synthase